MKKYLAFLLIGFAGCAFQHTSSLNPTTKEIQTFTQVVWFQKASVNGLKAHSRTKSGSGSAFSVSSESTETQTEALAAITEAAVKGAVQGAK